MSGHNFSRSVTTFSGNAMIFTSDMTTLSPNLRNITSNPSNGNITGKIQKEFIRDNSTNSEERNVFDPFNSVLYNPLLSVLDNLQLLGCVFIIVLIYKANRMKDNPSRFLLNNVLCDMSIGLSFLISNIPMLTSSDMSLIKKFLFAQKLILTLMRSEAMHTLAMMLFTLHLAICSHFYYKMHCRTRYFLLFLLVSWTFNIIYSCCIFFLELRDDLSLVIWLCVSSFPLPATILYITVSVVLPFLAISVFFIRIRIHMSQGGQACINQSLTRTYIRQAKVVYLIVFAFFLTFITSDILDLMMLHMPEIKLKDKLYLTKNVYAIVGHLFVYLKVPLLLYSFKSYGRVFLSMFNFCPSLASSKRSN